MGAHRSREKAEPEPKPAAQPRPSLASSSSAADLQGAARLAPVDKLSKVNSISLSLLCTIISLTSLLAPSRFCLKLSLFDSVFSDVYGYERDDSRFLKTPEKNIFNIFQSL